MNTQRLKRLLCLILALTMMAAATACGSRDSGDSSEDASLASVVSGAESSGVESEPGENSEASGTESNSSGTSSSSTAKSSTSSTPSTTKNGAKTSLTRDQVMAKMPAALKGATINYFIWESPKNTVQKNAIAAFERASGVKLNVEIGNKDQYAVQLAAKIASGKSPDMAFLLENGVSGINNFQPITNSGFDFNDTAWDDYLMKEFTFGGRTYATNLKNSPFRNMAVIHYNKKALRKAEMEDPYKIWSKNPKDWTWDKLWSMCDEFLKANRNREGYFGISFDIADGYPRSFGVSFQRYDSAKGQYVTDINSAETIKRYELLLDATNKKYASAVADSTAFGMGRILFKYSYSSALEKNANTSPTYWNDFGAVPVPTDSTVMPLYEYYAYGIPVGAMTNGKKAVPYYLRYVMDEKSYDLSNFFVHAEAKKVIDSSLARGKFFVGYGYKWDVWAKMTDGTSAQVKSILDSHYNEYKEACAASNEAIKKLPK